MSSREFKHIDLAEMPVIEKEHLCKVLDQKESWQELGKRMMFNEFEISDLQTEANRLRRSPSDVLITRWSSRYGHNVTELFKLLADMQHYQAMHVIKSLVNPAYHIWFDGVYSSNSQSKDDKQLNGQSQIFKAREEEAPRETRPNDEFKEKLKDLLNIPEIPLIQLEEATDKWAEKNILGKGGFGVVYKGEWISTKVAIKKLEYRESRSGLSKEHLTQSLNELRHLNHCRHDNILPVYGFAMKDDTCLVVYQLMLGGSLEERLWRRGGFEPLTWPQRWIIAKGTARGLQYLHRFDKMPLIHGDIKPANILLDTCCEPKIGDFGLSREGHQNDDYQEVSRVFGTKPYLPEEFLKRSLFSTKVDVFSFGVVLFELATNFRAYDKIRKHVFLYDHMARMDESSIEVIQSIIDPTTPNDAACFNLCQLMVYLGKKCTNYNSNYRPDMVSVFHALEKFVPEITNNGLNPQSGAASNGNNQL